MPGRGVGYYPNPPSSLRSDDYDMRVNGAPVQPGNPQMPSKYARAYIPLLLPPHSNSRHGGGFLPICLHQFLIEMKLFHTMFRRVIILIITHNAKHGLVIGNVNAPIPPAPPAAVDPSLKPIPIL